MTNGMPGICRSNRLRSSSPALEVVGHVDGRHVVGHRPTELQRLDDVAGDVRDRDDDALAPARRRRSIDLRADVDLEPATLVLAVDEDHRRDEERDDEDDQPGAESELRDGEDHASRSRSTTAPERR